MPKSKKYELSSSGKKILTVEQEFRMMLLVLDKFLWLGFGIMAFGLYKIVFDVMLGIALLIIGIIVLLLFTWILVKEFEIIKREEK